MTKIKRQAAQVRAALLRHFPKPECAVVFEVAQATGFDANRRLDAVAMELWPSRGLALHGIEIKVDLHDWRREKATPEKAEEVARYCDFFWIAAPKDLIPHKEVPMAWGMLELDGETLRETKHPLKTDAQAISRPFTAALLRAASRGIDPESTEAIIARRTEAMEEEFNARVEREVRTRVEREVRTRVGRQDSGSKAWSMLCEKIKADPANFLSTEQVIEAVRLVYQAGIANSYGGIRSLYDTVTKYQQELAAALDTLGVERDEPKRRRKRRAAG